MCKVGLSPDLKHISFVFSFFELLFDILTSHFQPQNMIFFICMVGLSPKLKHIAPSFVFSFFELKPVLAKPQLQKTNLGSLHFLLRFCRTNCHLHCHYYPIRLSGSKAQLTPLLKPGCISLYILCKPFANPCLVNKLQISDFD